MEHLVGFYRTDPASCDENRRLLAAMIRSLAAREEGEWQCHIDHRVAIGSLSARTSPWFAQPFRDPSHRYHLWVMGELDNGEEIAQKYGDGSPSSPHQGEQVGQALIALLHREGVQGVQLVRGSFLLCLYDSHQETLSLLSDRHGSRYLYWTQTSLGLVFGSELRGMLALPQVSKQVNQGAIANLLIFEFLLGNQTLFQDISLFPHATILTRTPEKEKRYRYWDYPVTWPSSPPPFPEMVRAASSVVRKAVHRYVHTHPHLGIPLSGGLDSRTLLCYAAEVREGIPVYHLQMHPAETAIARRVCQALHATWHTMDHRDFDPHLTIPEGMRVGEGQVSVHQCWLLPYVQKLSREHPPPYLLDGYLFDVLLGSLWLVLPTPSLSSAAAKVRQILRLWQMFPLPLARWLFTKSFYEVLASQPRAEVKEVVAHRLDASITEVVLYFALLNRGRRYTLAFTNLNRHYVPIGTPALDYDLVDFCLQVPPHYRVASRLHRAMLVNDFPHLAAIPWMKSGLPLDQDFSPALWRRKTWRKYGRYAVSLLSGGRIEKKPDYDHNYRFRHDPRFREFYLQVLRDPRTASRGIIDQKGIERLISLQQHGMNQFNLIDGLITVELWYRAYID
ncbi:MAG: asparagine synthase [Nitrospinota bacterium]|nr:MAG: asparagine synthase [Nitrospinota bacterium]